MIYIDILNIDQLSSLSSSSSDEL